MPPAICTTVLTEQTLSCTRALTAKRSSLSVHMVSPMATITFNPNPLDGDQIGPNRTESAGRRAEQLTGHRSATYGFNGPVARSAGCTFAFSALKFLLAFWHLQFICVHFSRYP